MSSVHRVPETSTMTGEELSADDARRTLRNYGRLPLARESFRRFRYGDGFSSSRALALQLCLAVIPLVIAFVGLGRTLHADRAAEVVTRTLLGLTPGASEDLVNQTLQNSRQNSGGELALWLGLAVAIIALTTAMGQAERGANRIYGIQRDRPTVRKYVRAALMALTAGLAMLAGFVVLLAGGELAVAVTQVYDVDATIVRWARWPVGVLLALLAVTVIFKLTPRRRQPGYSWLPFGSGVALVLWLAFTALLVLYVQQSGGFGATYGPLTAIIALLLWANLTSIALFLGVAFAAQLEAVRAGVTTGAPTNRQVDREPQAVAERSTRADRGGLAVASPH